MKNKTEMNTIFVRVKPNALKTEVLEKNENVWIIAIAAPADKDKANKELVRFLSKTLKKKVRIKSGMRSRDKTLVID